MSSNTERIWKFAAQGDQLYIKGETEELARAKFREHFGDVPESMLEITEVDAVPEGEELL